MDGGEEGSRRGSGKDAGMPSMEDGVWREEQVRVYLLCH